LAEILGRVTSRSLQIPRGPDVLHRIQVPQEWLERGALIELEVPRNLRCASCQGGGCDQCERSGAISLRSRGEPPEIIQVTLPRRSAQNLAGRGGVTIRIPEHGGLPRSSAEAVRGFLLLTVSLAPVPDQGVRLLESPAPAVVGVPSVEASPALARVQHDPPQPASGVRPVQRRRMFVPVAVATIVLLWVGFLVYLRLSGRG
jgi:hypothetical protein